MSHQSNIFTATHLRRVGCAVLLTPTFLGSALLCAPVYAENAPAQELGVAEIAPATPTPTSSATAEPSSPAPTTEPSQSASPAATAEPSRQPVFIARFITTTMDKETQLKLTGYKPGAKVSLRALTKDEEPQELDLDPQNPERKDLEAVADQEGTVEFVFTVKDVPAGEYTLKATSPDTPSAEAPLKIEPATTPTPAPSASSEPTQQPSLSPSEPSSPAPTAEPSETPVEPAEPTKEPTEQPSEPAQPEPTEEPTQPAEPAEPTKEPTAPAPTTEPSKPAEPEPTKQPAEPAKPVEPTTPAEPVKPEPETPKPTADVEAPAPSKDEDSPQPVATPEKSEAPAPVEEDEALAAGVREPESSVNPHHNSRLEAVAPKTRTVEPGKSNSSDTPGSSPESSVVQAPGELEASLPDKAHGPTDSKESLLSLDALAVPERPQKITAEDKEFANTLEAASLPEKGMDKKQTTDSKEFENQPAPSESTPAEALASTSKEAVSVSPWLVAGGIGFGVLVLGGLAYWFYTWRKKNS